MMLWIAMALLAALLLVGAATDVWSRRLPNWLTAAVAALYGVYVAVSPVPVDWPGALLVAGLVFLVGFGLFAFNLMGGGDVKLIAGLSLWAGVDHVALFLLSTSLAGGLLSILSMLSRHVLLAPFVPVLWPGHWLAAGREAAPTAPSGVQAIAGTQADDTRAVATLSGGSLPYGVAIAAGGFTVIHAILQL